MDKLQQARDTVYSFIAFDKAGELKPIEPSDAAAFLEAVTGLMFETDDVLQLCKKADATIDQIDSLFDLDNNGIAHISPQATLAQIAEALLDSKAIALKLVM
jgi:hypothetical protein